MNKKYCLVVTDDYSRFTWVFFLATKDETSGILKSFITEVENLVDKKVKIIRCDNGTEFKNRVMSEFCEKKGIKKEFSVARTPQQNGVAERRNRTLIEAARTMLADSKLPTTFWAEAVNTACYVQNRVLVVKPHNKTPYELFRGRTPALSFMRPFGCHVTILNTLDYLGKFDGKSDEGFFVGYSINSKAFRVYNIRTRKVEENLHIRFLEDKPIIAGDGPKWLFDIDVLTKSMNYVLVIAGTNSNDFADGSLFDSSSKNASNDESQPSSDARKKDDEGVNKESGIDDQDIPKNSTQDVNIVGPSINTASTNVNTGSLNINIVSPIVTTASLEATHANFFGDETEVDLSNITTIYLVPSTPNTRIHKDHSLDHVIGEVQSGVQTRRMTKTTNEQGFISVVYEGETHDDLYTCLFFCFLFHEEPKKVWTLVDLPHSKRATGTKWVYMNKKDERGIMIRNKTWLVTQGYTQEEGIDYNEVFAPVARIEAIRLFLAYASFKDIVVYQMDVKSAILYGKIEEEVYVCKPLGFEDPEFPDRVYKVEKALYGLHQAPRAWYETFSTYLLDNGFQRGLQVTQKDDGIFISQDKYMDEILKKFGFLTVKTGSTPMETLKPLMKDENAEDVDYPKDSPFDCEAYTDSDYAGASLDMKSTTGVNAGDSKLMLLGIHLLLPVLVNVVRHKLTTAGKVNAVRHNLLLLDYCWVILDTVSKAVNGEMKIQASSRWEKREGKGFSGRVTPLFQTMMVHAPKELGEGSEIPTDPQHTPTIIQPSTSQPQKKQSRRKQRKDIEDRLKLNELMELCTNLSQRVLDLENTKTSQAAEIATLKESVKKLERRNKSRTSKLKRLRKIGRSAQVVSSEDEGLGDQEDASK
ncbi:putative ribonuclease H-like domain-containing protein [Tanacetum coccineum]